MAALLLAVDLIWTIRARLNVDYGAFLPMLISGGGPVRRQRIFTRIGAGRTRGSAPCCSARAFLVVFSASASMLNYCLLSVAGHRVDASLAAIDRSLGFDWPLVMAAVAHHPAVAAFTRAPIPPCCRRWLC